MPARCAMTRASRHCTARPATQASPRSPTLSDVDVRDPAAVAELAAQLGSRSGGHRTRNPFGRRGCRRRSSARHRLFRTDPSGRAARREQGVRERDHGCRRRPDCGFSGLHRRPTGCRSARRVRPALRREGRRARGRQGGRRHPRPQTSRSSMRATARGSSSRSISTVLRSRCSRSPTARPSSRCMPAQDFKRVADDDQGPNTGGMGAYAPLPWAPTTLVDDVMRDVLQPTVDEMRRRGTPFAGLLYAGLALTSRGHARGRVQRALRRSRDAGRARAA